MGGTVLIDDIPRLLAEPAAAIAKLRRAILEECGAGVYCGDCERLDATVDDAYVIAVVAWEVKRRKDHAAALYEERERCTKLDDECGRLELRIQELERSLEL